MAPPLATYRLQLRPGFGFAAAGDLVGYLRDLGVTDVYLSPVFEARAGSEHGYDVTDPTRIRAELGDRAGFDALAGAVRGAGMGLVLDIVPSHMAATPANPWWRDVLRAGPVSPAAPVFDIDWTAGKVQLPILDRDLDDAIASGVVRLDADGVRVGADVFPVRGPVDAGEDVAAVLERQAYALARWTPGSAPSYRRFFDIDDLVAVRADDPAVFDQTHALILELVRSGAVTGLRVDHVDGLADPRAYLERLRGAVGDDTYVVVEKILTGGEELRDGWPVDGTTGYEAMNDLNALFVDPHGMAALDRVYGGASFAEEVRTAKHEVLHGLFGTELARVAASLGLPDPDALAAATVKCPAYRTYVDADGPAPEDVRVIDESSAAGELRERLLAGPSGWQQLTAPVMAKGREDTACYRHTRLVSLNDVGGEPDAPLGDAVADFHDRNVARAARGRHGLVATSTHDTKRSEDVRARINVLSEVAGAWHDAQLRWCAANNTIATVDDQRLLAQTLLGVWPASRDRVAAYLVKAAREAKRATNWLEPDRAYETALDQLVDAQLEDGAQRFLATFGELLPTVAFFGALNSLAQVTLKLAMPGVPDLYQGCELWDLSLVDPDNRRPVDFDTRREMLAQLDEPVSALLESWPDGRIKLFMTRRGLQSRRPRPALFRDGEYVPLAARGAHAGNVVAFARRRGDEWAVAVAPRLCTALTPAGVFPLDAVWSDTQLDLPRGAPTEWADAFTGSDVRATDGALRAADVFATLPVALLVT